MSYLIIDGHCDSILDVAQGKRSLTERSDLGHLDFPRLLEGQVALQFMALFIEQRYRPRQTVARALELIELLKQEVAKVNYVDLVLAAKDLEVFSPRGLKVLMAIEGGEALGGNIDNLKRFYDLGVRSLTLTWNYQNELAEGCNEVPSNQGLTALGQDVVKEMNKLGMLIDVSHLSERSFWDVLNYSTQPVIASHSCCQELCRHQRNLTNGQMKALAQQGGVLGINFYPPFLTGSSKATIEDVANHILYGCEIMGADHVALGSDYDGIDGAPQGLGSVLELSNLIGVLEKRGLKPELIAKIMGKNILRLLQKVL